MPVPNPVFEEVRRRAASACEYCGVREDEAGGLLTVDHHHPTAHGGSDDLENLVYACFRCNTYKANYWPEKPGELHLWNPRRSPTSEHFIELHDGRLLTLTDVGAETVRRLRLNRVQLIEYRSRTRRLRSHAALLTQLAEITARIAQAEADQALFIGARRELLEEQQRLLHALLKLTTQA